MDQTDELPYEAALQPAQNPVINVGSASPTDINSILQQATSMANEGGPGANAEKAQQWLQQQMEGLGATNPREEDSTSDIMDYDAVKPISAGKEVPFDSVKPITTTPPTADSKAAMVGKSFLTGLQTSVLDPFFHLQASALDYISHPQDLNSQEGGEVTPQQAAAAKLIGADVGKVWGPILKMSPKQLAEADERTDRLFGLDPKEQKKRAEAVARGEVYSGPVEGLLQHSAVKDLLSSVYNPNKSNTLLFHKVNEIAHLMEIAQHPDKYDPEAVKAAQEVIDAYKEQASKSTWTKVKESLGEMAKNPLSLVNTTLADPELLLAPEIKVGTAAYGSKAALAAEAALKAQRYAKLADAIAKSATAMPDVAAAATAKAEHYGAEAAKLSKGLSDIGKKAHLLDVASAGAAGAGINVGISAEQQKAQQGYVQKGTLGPAAVVGGALGAGLSALGGRSIKSPKLPEDLTTRVAPGEPTKVGPNVENVSDVNAGKLPGEPLSPATPVNKESHVPYYGGVDASGKVIHIDEKTPENLPIKSLGGKKVNIPVLKTVAYHESVEFPLMHMEGPISPETLSQLYTRIGKEGKIPQEIVDKLKEGKSLSYPEAHEIATLAENHLVRTLYKVDPKVYQDALKPYIKEVGKANKEATGADIPPGLDTKPYDDMGHPEVLKGAGDVPPVDKGQGGSIDRRLLATGVASAGGATLAGAMAPEGEKKQAALAGALGGLFLGMNMWGDAIPRKGMGKQEGMFAGPLSKLHDSAKEAEARAMKAAGKTPEQINFRTGMFEGAGGHFYSEISDNKAAVHQDKFWGNGPIATNLRNGKGVPLSSIMDHAEMDKAYPGLSNKIKVRINPKQNGAYYDFHTGNITISTPDAYPKTGLDTFPKVLLHEVNHAIQHYEGFPRGDSPTTHIKALKQEFEDLDRQITDIESRIREAQQEGNDRYALTLSDERDALEKKMQALTPDRIHKIAWDRYNRSAGENMSVATQERADLSAEQRRMQVPKMRHAKEGQIVRYNVTPSPHLRDTLHLNKMEEGVAAHELPNLATLRDNYRKKLSNYTKEVYHETNGEKALTLIPGSNLYTIPESIYVANTPEMALGQGVNKGVLIKFDAAKLEGQINKNKPAWEPAWNNGAAEFITSNFHSQSDYQKAVSSVTIKPDLVVSKVVKAQLHNAIRNMESHGWLSSKNPDGSITYKKPEVPLEGVDAHEIPLSEHLKKTGDMDEEGTLHGLVLAEDRLPNEQAIIGRAKMGDQQAITALYKKYMPRLERTLRSMMREAGPRLGIDSEDIASQAFMKATQALPDFKGDSAFYTWLYSIARNEALNAIGKGNRQVPTTSMFAGGSKVGPEGGSAMTPAEGGIESAGGSPIRPGIEAIASTQDTPEAMSAAQQASNMVRYAISKLPQEIREAVKMKDLVGMTEQEIAAAQGVPVGTVKSRLSRGRDMLQQSIKRGHGAQFRAQGGFATPEALKKLGKIALLGGGGATLGAMYLNPENKLAGAWAGAAIALVGGEVKWNRLFPSLREMMAKDDRINVNTLLDNYDAALATAERTVAQVQYRIDKLAPGKESQRKITYWLDGDRSVQLTPNEMEAAKIARQFYDSLGQVAHQKGVLEDFLQNYVNHEWGDSAKAKELQDQIASTFATNMSPKDRHALARKFLTLAQGKEAGLVPRTENINDLIGIYSNSMSKAMANKTLLEVLKGKVLDPTAGVKAIMPAGKAPYNFVPIAHPQLNGVRVHPSIAPSLDFLFHTTNRGVIISAVEGLNTATKRLEVSLSLFHVKALIDAFLGANPLSSPIKNLVNIATSMAGKSAAHREYLGGGPGDVTDLLLRNGLKVNPRKGQLSDEDIKTGFYEALDGLQQFMDQVVPGTGKPLALMKKANKISDKFIWENVHTGLKATTAMNAYERLTRAHAKELLKDPNYKMPSADELARQAASFTNDTFGGLNWRRLADDATTKIGRNLSLVLASPLGRRISQVMMFAPDWTYSTIRSFLKAADTGSGLKGLLQPKTLADLHRQYLIRSSIIYLTLYNALNMAMSGHPIWDNKDPLTVDLGNGERMQANKHFMETPHMILHPAKFAIGKLGIIPSEVLEQALHKEYLTTGQMPEMKGGRLAHIGKRFLPFAGQSFQQQGVPEMMANLAGFPIYGTHPPRTPEEVAAARRKKKESAEKAKKTRRENKLRKMYGE